MVTKAEAIVQTHKMFRSLCFYDYRKTLLFTTPGLPFIPAIAVTVNIYLIFKLSYLTLVRFLVWMSLGKYVPFRNSVVSVYVC